MKRKREKKYMEMMGVYRRTTQPLENSLDSFSFDEDYLDDDYESISSLSLSHSGYLKPQNSIYVNNM